MSNLKTSIINIITKSLGLKSGEKFFIVADKRTEQLAKMFLKEAMSITQNVEIGLVKISLSGQEPPGEIAEKMKMSDVVVMLTTSSYTHTKARIEANASGARIASMPNVNEDIIIRAGNADYEMIAKKTSKLGKILDRGSLVLIKTKAGTNLELNISGRKSLLCTGLLQRPGSIGNIPGGETFIAPIEGSANGNLVVDGSVAGIGKVRDTINISIVEGYAKSIDGGREADLLKARLDKFGKDAYAVSELGIGTNNTALLSGHVVEDEKVVGTAHIVLGKNVSFGGKIDVPIHIDLVFLKPTITVDDILVIDNGKFLI